MAVLRSQGLVKKKGGVADLKRIFGGGRSGVRLTEHPPPRA